MKFKPDERTHPDADARAWAVKQLERVEKEVGALAEWEEAETFDHYYNEFLRIHERDDAPAREEAEPGDPVAVADEPKDAEGVLIGRDNIANIQPGDVIWPAEDPSMTFNVIEAQFGATPAKQLLVYAESGNPNNVVTTPMHRFAEDPTRPAGQARLMWRWLPAKKRAYLDRASLPNQLSWEVVATDNAVQPPVVIWENHAGERVGIPEDPDVPERSRVARGLRVWFATIGQENTSRWQYGATNPEGGFVGSSASGVSKAVAVQRAVDGIPDGSVVILDVTAWDPVRSDFAQVARMKFIKGQDPLPYQSALKKAATRAAKSAAASQKAKPPKAPSVAQQAQAKRAASAWGQPAQQRKESGAAVRARADWDAWAQRTSLDDATVTVTPQPHGVSVEVEKPSGTVYQIDMRPPAGTGDKGYIGCVATTKDGKGNDLSDGPYYEGTFLQVNDDINRYEATFKKADARPLVKGKKFRVADGYVTAGDNVYVLDEKGVWTMVGVYAIGVKDDDSDTQVEARTFIGNEKWWRDGQETFTKPPKEG